MHLNRSFHLGVVLAWLALVAAAPAARADNVYWSLGVAAAPGVHIGLSNARPVLVLPAPPVYVQAPPVFVQPAPVYLQPQGHYYTQPMPIYTPPRVIYTQPPLYVQPAYGAAYYGPPVHWERPYHGYGHKHGHKDGQGRGNGRGKH